MANMNLTRYESDDELEFFVDESTGVAYASQRATARMCNTNVSNIYNFVRRSDLETLEARVETGSGFQGVHLLTSESVFRAAIKYNEELALKMGAIGANSYICHKAGYQLKLESPFKETETQAVESAYDSKPRSMFTEVLEVFIEARQRGLEDRLACALLHDGEFINRETRDYLASSQPPIHTAVDRPEQNDSDLQSAMARQPGTGRRGRKAEDRILSKYPLVYYRYGSNRWYAKFQRSNGEMAKVPGMFETDLEAHKARERFVKQLR